MFPLISVDPKSVEPLLGKVCVVVRVNSTPVENTSVVKELKLPSTENDPSELVVVSGPDGTDLPDTLVPVNEISTLPLAVLMVASVLLFSVQFVAALQLLNSPTVE
jgi:hypothetical protein